MFTLKFTNQFKKDVKTLKKRSAGNAELISSFLEKLQFDGAAGIDQKYKPHKLSGNYLNDWKAHLKIGFKIPLFKIKKYNFAL